MPEDEKRALPKKLLYQTQWRMTQKSALPNVARKVLYQTK
jgi:hypothetical protein